MSRQSGETYPVGTKKMIEYLELSMKMHQEEIKSVQEQLSDFCDDNNLPETFKMRYNELCENAVESAIFTMKRISAIKVEHKGDLDSMRMSNIAPPSNQLAGSSNSKKRVAAAASQEETPTKKRSATTKFADDVNPFLESNYDADLSGLNQIFPESNDDRDLSGTSQVTPRAPSQRISPQSKAELKKLMDAENDADRDFGLSERKKPRPSPKKKLPPPKTKLPGKQV